VKDHKIQRRVAGYHDIRMDGMTDLVMRARGASVMDIGCNRGLVGFEFANNGASLVHGCDNYEPGIMTAREVFADLRAVESKFEVVDLSQGRDALAPFGDQTYYITVMLATYHKLKRIMPADTLSDLMSAFAKRTNRYFGWRGTSHDHAENETEMTNLDRDLGKMNFKRIQTSYISDSLGVAAIWRRQ